MKDKERRTEKQYLYDLMHTCHFSLKLNTGTDKEIIAWIQRQKNKQGAIKELILERIELEKQ